jgi:DNA-binding GntR family transcriptional regulator
MERAIGIPAYAALRDQIRADVIAGKLPAGMRLTIADLVKRYGVSQMPVREALQALEGEGVITILPHRGARVLSLDAPRVRNVYDIRAAIEGLLIRLSVPNLTHGAMVQLAAIQQQFREAAQKRKVETLFALNWEFHNLIYRHAGNPEALEIFDRYASLLGTLRRQYGYDAVRTAQMVKEHEQILAALRKPDEEQLEKLARRHCEGAKKDLLARMTSP